MRGGKQGSVMGVRVNSPPPLYIVVTAGVCKGVVGYTDPRQGPGGGVPVDKGELWGDSRPAQGYPTASPPHLASSLLPASAPPRLPQTTAIGNNYPNMFTHRN